jgi:hypothetical protein
MFRFLLQMDINLTVPENLEDIDYAAFYFNKALVSFHCRQYRAALKIVRKLFQYVEPLGEFLFIFFCTSVNKNEIFVK